MKFRRVNLSSYLSLNKLPLHIIPSLSAIATKYGTSKELLKVPAITFGSMRKALLWTNWITSDRTRTLNIMSRARKQRVWVFEIIVRNGVSNYNFHQLNSKKLLKIISRSGTCSLETFELFKVSLFISLVIMKAWSFNLSGPGDTKLRCSTSSGKWSLEK